MQAVLPVGMFVVSAVAAKWFPEYCQIFQLTTVLVTDCQLMVFAATSVYIYGADQIWRVVDVKSRRDRRWSPNHCRRTDHRVVVIVAEGDRERRAPRCSRARARSVRPLAPPLDPRRRVPSCRCRRRARVVASRLERLERARRRPSARAPRSRRLPPNDRAMMVGW